MHTTGTSDSSDICDGFTRFLLKFYNLMLRLFKLFDSSGDGYLGRNY